jgi:hypothetical protein
LTAIYRHPFTHSTVSLIFGGQLQIFGARSARSNTGTNSTSSGEAPDGHSPRYRRHVGAAELACPCRLRWLGSYRPLQNSIVEYQAGWTTMVTNLQQGAQMATAAIAGNGWDSPHRRHRIDLLRFLSASRPKPLTPAGLISRP